MLWCQKNFSLKSFFFFPSVCHTSVHTLLCSVAILFFFSDCPLRCYPVDCAGSVLSFKLSAVLTADLTLVCPSVRIQRMWVIALSCTHCLKCPFLLMQSFTITLWNKRKKKILSCMYIFMIVIFINVSDTAEIAVLLNLWSGCRGMYVLYFL